MKQLPVVAICLGLLTAAAGCQKAEQSAAAQPVEKVVDSLVEQSMPALRREAAEDLDRRRAIEVRVKRDSLVRQALHGAPDSPAAAAAAFPRRLLP